MLLLPDFPPRRGGGPVTPPLCHARAWFLLSMSLFFAFLLDLKNMEVHIYIQFFRDLVMPILWIDLPEILISKGVVTNSNAATTTANYAAMWMQGATLDFSKSAANVHRARLRKIGIDIKKPYEGQFYDLEQSREIMAKRYLAFADSP